jgi:hypothetical protein
METRMNSYHYILETHFCFSSCSAEFYASKEAEVPVYEAYGLAIAQTDEATLDVATR